MLHPDLVQLLVLALNPGGTLDFYQQHPPVLIGLHIRAPFDHKRPVLRVILHEPTVRPENILLSKEGDGIPGKIERMYYLGDVNDCRVRVGSALVRVICEGLSHRCFSEGDEVLLTIREFILFPDDGSMDEQLKIRT